MAFSQGNRNTVALIFLTVSIFPSFAWSQEQHKKTAYISFHNKPPIVLRALSMETLLPNISHEERVALLFKPTTLSDVLTLININSLGEEKETLSERELTQKVNMCFNPKNRFFEITVCDNSEVKAEEICRAILNAYRCACEQMANRKLREFNQNLDQSISIVSSWLERQRQALSSDKDKGKVCLSSIKEKVFENILYDLVKVKTVISLPNSGLIATGWHLNETIATISLQAEK